MFELGLMAIAAAIDDGSLEAAVAVLRHRGDGAQHRRA